MSDLSFDLYFLLSVSCLGNPNGGLARKAPIGPIRALSGQFLLFPVAVRCGGIGTDRPRKGTDRPWKGPNQPRKGPIFQALPWGTLIS